MPSLRANLEVCAGKLNTPAVYDVVEAKVVFQRVGADDVVVVFVSEAKEEARSLVHRSGDSLEFDAQGQVFVAGSFGNGQGKAIIRFVLRGLRQHVGSRRRRRLPRHHPLAGCPLTGERRGKPLGGFSWSIVIDVLGVLARLSG